MKSFCFALVFLHLGFNVFANEITVDTKVQDVIIYHSGALVNRVATTELKPGLNELVFMNVSSKIILNSLQISNKEVTILNKTIVRKLTAEEFNQLLDEKEALNKTITLIETKFNEAGFINKVEDLEKMTAFYAQKMMQSKKELRQVISKIEEAKKLEEIVLKNENAAILKVNISIESTLREPLKMNYVCGGIGWSPAYEITVENPSKSSLQIKYMAKAMSQTGEDWENISIRLSSSFPLESPNSLPKADAPWVIGYNYKQSNSYNNPNQSVENNQQQIKLLEGVEYDDVDMPSFLKLRTLKGNYSIKSNSTVFTFPIETVNLPSTFYYYGFPGVDQETYLVAQVLDWDTLGYIDGVANINYGGNSVGKSNIKFSESMDTLLLPVGKDNSVFMRRTEIADQKYFRIQTISKRKKITMAYQYELKNNNSFAIEYELIDQFPISQTKEAEVILDNVSGGKVIKETGEVIWKMRLKPGESVKKELIYTIDMEADFDYRSGKVSIQRKTMNAKF